MLSPFALVRLFRDPRGFMLDHLQDRPNSVALFVHTVLPFASIRPLAILVRSLFLDSLVPGIVLALGSWVLQASVYAGAALLLPALAHQLAIKLEDRAGRATLCYAFVPLWLAGVLFVFPDEFGWLMVWSRVMVALTGLTGLYLFARGLRAQELDSRQALALTIAMGLTVAVFYAFLSLFLAISAHIAIYLLGAGA